MKTQFQRFYYAVFCMAVLTLISCNTDSDSDSDPDPAQEYPEATAKVDYNNGAKKAAVFIDFSSDTVVRELPLDFFDFAVYSSGSGASAEAYVIANSGSYGSGVLVYKTNLTDITADMSALANSVKEYTFKAGTNLYNSGQTAANPFDGGIRLMSNSATDGRDKVFIIKTAANNYYKVLFNVFGMSSMSPPTPGYSITIVKDLNGTTEIPLTAPLAGISAGFGYIWFKLDGTAPRALNTATELADGAPDIPKAAEWDLLCTRTNEYQSEDGNTISTQMPVASRSSILLNTYKGVKAYTAEEKLIEQVLNTDGLAEQGDVDAIGYGWYTMTGMPPTFSVKNNTYVIKTAEGNYAKFQPLSFYGPNTESFYMRFSYLYQDDGSATFSK
jgi:hypothetical protein